MDLTDFQAVVSPATPRTVGGGSVVDGRLSEAVAMDLPCFLCEETFGTCNPSDLTAALGNRQIVHRGCYNATHAEQIADGMADDEAKARIKQLKRVDEGEWRSMCMALKSNAFSRTASQRQTAKTYIEEIVAETRVSREEKSFLFSESQYIVWYGLNEGLTRTQAAQKWAEDLHNESVYKERAGNKVWIAVKAPTVLRQVESVAKRRKMQNQSGPLDMSGAQQAVARRATLSAPSC